MEGETMPGNSPADPVELELVDCQHLTRTSRAEQQEMKQAIEELVRTFRSLAMHLGIAAEPFPEGRLVRQPAKGSNIPGFASASATLRQAERPLRSGAPNVKPRTSSRRDLVLGAAQSHPVRYDVSVEDPKSHRLQVVVDIPEVSGNTIDLVLPSWAPGSYIIRPARNVRDVRASQANTGASLPIVRQDKARWRVTTEGAAHVEVR